MMRYSLENNTVQGANVSVSVEGNKYYFNYPCKESHICTDYVIELQAGLYKFQLYGASGGSHAGQTSSFRKPDGSCISDDVVSRVGGNTICNKIDSNVESGGYVKGIILFQSAIKIFATIGGKGIFGHKITKYGTADCFYKENMQPGGYGGGGSSSNYYQGESTDGTGSGGGQTAVKFIENDLWHRVLVSGGGGGSENRGGTYRSTEDGSGGAGGNLNAQGYFLNGAFF